MRALVFSGIVGAAILMVPLDPARAQDQAAPAAQDKPVASPAQATPAAGPAPAPAPAPAPVAAPAPAPTSAPAPAMRKARISKKVEAEFARGAQAYDQKKFEEALSIWLPLTKVGNPRILYNVGLMYANGLGIPKDDYVEAYKWFDISAARAEDPREKKKAERMRDMVGLELTPDQLTEAKARIKAWHPRWTFWR